MAKLQYMDYTDLTLFKQLLDSDTLKKIEAADLSNIKTVSQSQDKYIIYFYTKKAPVTEDEAAFSISLPNPTPIINAKADKVKNAVGGHLAGLNAAGNLVDSGKSVSDFEEAGAANAAKAELLKFIGTIPADAVAKTIVAYIKEAVAAGTYDDSALKALINGNTAAIDIINGTGEGSLKKGVADALTEFVAGAPENLDTYKELVDWVMNHASDAAEMNSNINTNTANIATLKSFVGALPAGTVSTTIIEYIAEYVSKAMTDSDLSQYAKADDLDAAVGRIDIVEDSLSTTNTNVSKNTTEITNIKSKLGDIPEGSVSTTLVGYARELVNAIRQQLTALTTRVTTAEGNITTLQADMKQAKTDITTNASGIKSLQGLVGDGFEPIPEDKIRALFA